MPRHWVLLAAALMLATPVWAAELPTRKAGLWELKMEFVGRNFAAQVMKHCTDASTDKLMNLNFAGSNERACSKQDMKADGGTITVDSICKFGDVTTTSHAVVTGDFNSAYTVDVTSTRQGGHPIPGAAGGQSHMTITAKWLGACAAGQRPGDVITSNGMTMNVLDMQKGIPPHGAMPAGGAGRPLPPR